MAFYNTVEFRTVEFPDALEFTIRRESGWLEQIAAPILVGLVLWTFWRTGALWPRIIAGLAGIVTVVSWLASWLQGRDTTLRITGDEVVAEGNLGHLFMTEIRVAPSDVLWIGYDSGGEGGTSGLYLRIRWGRTCVLPGLNQEQARSLVECIEHRFPGMIPTEYEGSLMLWDDGPLTQLNLSERARGDSERKP